jgi:uncharacterized membrane protein YhaH (DUF805 family)
MTFTESIQTCFKKYADFSGCASRSEYWWWTLFVAAVGLVLQFTLPLAYILFALAVIVPGFAVTIRRLHDTGRSGWWWLIGFVPLVGAIVLLIFFIQDSKSDSPYAVAAEPAPV